MSKSAFADTNDEFYRELHQFLQRILAEQSPDEERTFADLGPELLKHYVESDSSNEMQGISFEFSPILESGCIAGHLIAATVSVIEDRSLQKDQTNQGRKDTSVKI